MRRAQVRVEAALAHRAAAAGGGCTKERQGITPITQVAATFCMGWN